jgi:glc operon protein GlcG
MPTRLAERDRPAAFRCSSICVTRSRRLDKRQHPGEFLTERIDLMTLTLADANRVIAGAIEKANQINVKMNIAVCDAGGRLLAFQRMDGAMWAGSFGSQGKAMASAAFGRPSGDLTPRADHPTLRGIAAAEGNHMFYGQGAVPIFRQGVLIGACGVGGGTAQEDEDCARAGVEKL